MRRSFAGLILLLVAVSAGTVAADETPSAVFDVSGWRVDCTTKAQGLDCAAIDQVVQRGTNQQLAMMTVRLPAETKKPVLLVQLPLGIAVASGIMLTVGDGAPQAYPIQTCTQAGCFAGAALADRQLALMRTSAVLRLAWGNLEKQTTTVTMPLSGFAACYDKLK